jgi:hypothetical protein
MFKLLQVAFLISVGFFFGQSAFPVSASAGVVDRVVDELANIAAAVDRVGDRFNCEKNDARETLQ